MFKKIICILLAVCFALPLSSCSTRRQVTGVSVYTHEGYHFSFTRPAVFSDVELIENEEDDDECDIFFRDPEGDRVITLSCKFNPNENFYAYATENGFDKDKITSVNQNTFIYDARDSDNPEYYLISATKRMIFQAEYKYEDKNSTADREVCDSLKFEFDIYANTPKQNPLLSEKIYLFEDKFSIKVPANAVCKLLPEADEPTSEETAPETAETTGEEERVPSAYTSITASGNHYTASYKLASSEEAFLQLGEITEQMALAIESPRITEVSDGMITDISVSKSELLSCAQGNYIFISFTCTYNGNSSYGAYGAGYSASGYFYEYAYACSNDAPSGESEQFRQMLQSVTFEQ